MWMMLTIAAAALCGLLLLKLKVPGGMLVGAIIGAASLNLITQQAFIYAQTRVLAQSLTGAYIGCMITREDVRHLPPASPPLSGGDCQSADFESDHGLSDLPRNGL